MIEYFIYPLSPLLSLGIATILIFLLTLLPFQTPKKVAFPTALLGSLIALACLWHIKTHWPINFFNTGYIGNSPFLQSLNHGFYLSPNILNFLMGIVLFSTLSLVFLYTYLDDKTRHKALVLTLVATMSGMILVSANHFIMILIGIEMLSLPTCSLMAANKNLPHAVESAIKYYLFSTLGTVLIILSISLIYIQFGSFSLAYISEQIQNNLSLYPRLPLLISVALMLCGLGLKIGIVPFHMWIPDAYEGAPSPVTALLETTIKLSLFGFSFRLLYGIYLPFFQVWAPFLGTIASIGVVFGSLAALRQNNLKRIFAYLSISHTSLLTLSLSTFSHSMTHMHFFYYYIMVYGLMFLGVFAVLTLIERQAGNVEILQISGLGFSHPLLALCLTLFCLAGAGIPPTAGFLSKFLISLHVIKSGQLVWAILALAGSLIGAYSYLRVVSYLYSRKPRERLALSYPQKLAFICVLLCAVSMLFLTWDPEILQIQMDF